MENYKELLTALYKEYAPEKIDQIDFYLERYKGKEKQFYITQKAKYTNKKSVTDSKKILEEAMARIKKKGETSDIKSPPPIHTEKPKSEIEKKIKPKKDIITEEKASNEPIIIKKEKTIDKEEKTEKKVEKAIEENTLIEQDKKGDEVIKPLPASKKEVTNTDINPPIKESENKSITSKEISDLEKTKPIIKTDKKPDEIKENTPIKKDDREKIKQDSWKLEKEKLQQSKINSQKEEKKKKTPVLWYFGVAAIIILLVALAVWFLHFRNTDNKKEEAINVQKVKVEKKEVTTVENKSEETKEVQESKKNSETQKASSAKGEKQIAEKEQPLPKEKDNKPTKKPKNQKGQTRPSADRIYSKDISRPAIFIGCFATKTENMAQKKIAVLKQNGLDAHYYWIPDLDPKGNSFFKVVAGPFSTIKDAYPSLTKAQERINFDSYILVLE